MVSGFESGISDSPSKGISDMRNMDIISVPGESSVAFAPTNTATNYAISGVTFTASNSGGDLLLTYNGTVPLAINVAITVSGSLPTGLTANTAYYVTIISGTTFKVSLTAGGSPIAFTDAGSGTLTFTAINMGQPKYIINEPYKDSSSGTSSTSYHYYSVDGDGRVWYYYNNTQWVYMSNFADERDAGTDGGNGLVVYPGAVGGVTSSYLFNFRTNNIDYINTFSSTSRTLSYLTTHSNWVIAWKALSTSGYTPKISHQAIVGQDNYVYFCNGSFVGSFGAVPGTAFNPAGTINTDYTFTLTALSLPTTDIAQCLAELGVNLLVGGAKNQIYPWDRVSTSFTYPILISENSIYRMVTVNTNTYIFAGQRGRIFITNGSQANLYKKMPDHLSGTVNPYYIWGDATFSRNQLYFGVQATDNTGTAINQYGGTWAIDLDTKALRLLTQQSYGTYAGITSALSPVLGNLTSNGFGLLMGWYTSANTTGGIDKSSSSPYTGGQSYVDSDLIPIGRYIDPQTPTQIEWKTSVPLVAGESVAMFYRLNFNDSYSVITSTTTSFTGLISELLKSNFQKAQWLQLRAVLTSTASSPSYCRLTEFRIRDYPSGQLSR